MTPDTAPAPAAPRATAREFLAVLFRRRWIILGLFAAVVVVVAYLGFGTTESFISSGQVLVRRGEELSAMQPLRQVPNDWEIEIGSEVETARSWPVVKAAQRIVDASRAGRLTLDPDRVNVQVSGRTNVLQIAYTDRDPRVAERACDALLRAYVDYRQGSQLGYPARFFDNELAKASAQMEHWSALRRAFTERTGIVDLETERSNLITVRAGMVERRSGILGDLAQAETADRLVRQMSKDPTMEAPNLLQSSTNDAAIEMVKQQIVGQTTRIARLRETFRDDSPEVTNAQRTLDTLRTLLDREMAARYAATHSRVGIHRANLDAIDRDLAQIGARLERLGDLASESAEIDRQITVWRERYKELAKSSDQARVNTNTVRRISVILLNPASPARVQNKHDYVRLGLAPAFSLVVGVGLAFFMDGVDLTVHTAGQAEEEVRLPVLAAVTERRRDPWRPAARGPETESA